MTILTTQVWPAETQFFVIRVVSVASDESGTTHETATIMDRDISDILPKTFRSIPSCPFPVFDIRDTECKGKGMFANQKILAGTLIIQEHPVIVTPAIVPLSRDSGIYPALFANLSPSQREELLTMTNCRTNEECSTEEEGISRTNGTGIDLPIPATLQGNPEANEYGAVFLKINRSNHSCGPNAAQKWDLNSFSASLYALRDIALNEEITMIYTDATAPRDVRRAKLSRLYGFECTCPFCDLRDPGAVAQSNLDRLQLRDWNHLNPRYSSWVSDLCRPDDMIIASHKNALTLIEKEGMHGLQEPYIEEIALSYAQLGDEEQFKFWGRKLMAICTIQNPTKAAQFGVWLSNPKSMKRWGWRKRQRQQPHRKVVTEVEELELCGLYET